MNGSRDTAVDLLSAIASGVSQLTGVEIVVCPPFVLISQAIAALADTGVAVGGQDLDPNMPGAFTGQINAALLLDQGCRSRQQFVVAQFADRVVIRHGQDLS